MACLRVLVFAGLAVLGWSQPPAHDFLFWSITVIYGLTILGYLASSNAAFGLRRVRYAIFLFDVAMVCTLLVLRGRDVQALVMAYFTLILLAGLLAGIGTALVNAVIVSAIYTVVTCWGAAPEALLAFERVGPMLFFFVIAVFMGHVARDARTRSERTKPLGGVPSLRESTARLRAARSGLQAEERLHTLGLLSAGIAHEMRRPLGALVAGAQEGASLLDDIRTVLAAGADPHEVLRELESLFEDCAHAAGDLQQVAVALNETGRGGSAETRAVTADETVAEAERLLRKAAGADVELRVAVDATRAVLADPARLRQVLLILGDNALAALGDRGTLRLRAEDAGAERVAFIVEDDGCGIAPETLTRMYDPFFSTRGTRRGAGLGLFVLREIVNTLGGDVSCTSTPGDGTTFRVELPAAPPMQEAAEAA